MMGFGDGSGISWTKCKQSVHHSRQITIPTPHHSLFIYTLDALPDTNRIKALKAIQQVQHAEIFLPQLQRSNPKN